MLLMSPPPVLLDFPPRLIPGISPPWERPPLNTNFWIASSIEDSRLDFVDWLFWAATDSATTIVMMSPVAHAFRSANMPCDAMIYLSTGFAPSGWNSYNGEFDWNSKAFPKPAESMAALNAEHFKVVIHVVLEGRTLTGRAAVEGRRFIWPCKPIDHP